ncbi:PAS domain-containing sensor histidine kinase [Rhodopirellula bahusiensis]|uniref:PAS domain-containing sensor histidine kinase n=1 Tax=Rhodopirellula bahusiensis TaxID=2014065 RepID=UPI001E3B059B|nr:ATP-binding protein [Rhodopirellula bahusiensis]
MNNSNSIASGTPPKKSKNAHDAQRRVRWLSATAVCSGVLFFAIATALLNWHEDSRTKADLIEAQVNDARLAMSRVTVSRNKEWTELLSDSAVTTDAPLVHLGNHWHEELLLVQSTCDSLNAALDFQGDERLQIKAAPLKEWNNRAEIWKRRQIYLTAMSERRFSELDRTLVDLLQTADKKRGIHRLNLALGLRSHLSNQPKPIAEIMRDCAGSTLTNQLSGDIKQLRFNLSQLIATPNVDDLTDMSQNHIRPILLRLKASTEELGKSKVIDEVESTIFDPMTDHIEPRKSPGSFTDHLPGLLALQFALAESRSERERLVELAAEHASMFDEQRNKLALAGAKQKNRYSESFAKTLKTVWGVNLASGAILGLIFLILTRKVSKDIAMQVDAIDHTATELANEQLLLGSVLSNLPIPLFWKDQMGCYQGCSRSFAQWMGLTSEADIVGKTDAELPWEIGTREHKIALESSIMRYGIPIKNQEMAKHRSDGRSFVVLASKTPLRNLEDKSVGLVGAYIDITERKAAEERLNGLAKIQAECPSEIYVFSTHNLELLELNHAACQNLLVDETGYRGKGLPDFLDATNAKKLKKHLQPIIQGDAVEVEYESTHQRTDGTTYPVHVRTLTIEHESKQVFVACATDMTSYKKLENKLAQAQKLESIGQLAAGIAHEINTPMQCIGGNIDFLQEHSGRLLAVVDTFQELLKMSPESREKRIETALEMLKENRLNFIRSQFPMAIEETSTAASRVVEIVRAMRVMSHPGSQAKSDTDINALIHDASILSRNRWKCVASVELSLASDLPIIGALPAELSQVFLNLIINAADAIGETLNDDSIELGEIDVTTRFDDNHVYIEIRDNGPGMSDEVKAKAFEPFFTTKEVGKGTGQGLSITYDVITKLHQGTVEIQSELGEGTLFTLSLPRETKQTDSSTNAIAVAPMPMPAIDAPIALS